MILNNFYELQKLKTFSNGNRGDTAATFKMTYSLNINYFSVRLMNGEYITNPSFTIHFYYNYRGGVFNAPTLSPYLFYIDYETDYQSLCSIITDYNYNPSYNSSVSSILLTFGSDNTPPQLTDYQCISKIDNIKILSIDSSTYNPDFNEATTIIRFRNDNSSEITIREMTINCFPYPYGVSGNISITAIYREVFDDVVVPSKGDFLLTYNYSLTTGEPNVSFS